MDTQREREIRFENSAPVFSEKNFDTGIEEFDDILENLLIWDGRGAFALDVPRAILAELGNPQDNVPAVHVAGTNGKGSVCSYMASMLRASGANVGQTVSPHLSSVTERCLVNGEPVSAEALFASVQEVLAAAERIEVSPSFFETIALASFVEFSKRSLDWMVIEVGLGGRLDATNTIAKQHACVISNIALDHTNVLGNTLGAIAGEKAGIMRPDVPVFVGAVPDEAEAVIRAQAEEVGCPVYMLGKEFGYSPLLLPSAEDIPHQRDNMALAVRIAESLGVNEQTIGAGLRAARWPGRLEFVLNNRVLLDVAHNPNGLDSLLRFLENRCKGGRVRALHFLVSILDRKDWQTMLASLRRAIHDFRERYGVLLSFTFTTSAHPHVVAESELCQHMGCGVTEADPAQAMHKLLESSEEDDLVVVTGSLYLVGAVRGLLVDDPFRTIVTEGDGAA